MNIFENVSLDGVEESEDRVMTPGPLDTGIYKATIKLVYIGEAQNSDAKSINIHLDIDGKEVRLQEWILNREGKAHYIDKKTKKKVLLPGFQNANDIFLITGNPELLEAEPEEKVVKLWDFESRAEVPQKVLAYPCLHGSEIGVALVRQIQDKKTQQADGSYQPSGETREENIVEKYFDPESGRTVLEAKKGITEAIHIPKWAEVNAGKPPRNKSKGAAPSSGKPGRPGNPRAQGSASTTSSPKAKSLFPNSN